MDDVEAHAREIFEVPFIRATGARFDRYRDGVSRATLLVDERCLNANLRLHGGVIHTLLDMAAYLAVAPTLEGGQTAVTHNLNVSVFGAAQEGSEVVFEGQIVHRGRRLAVIHAHARVNDRTIATANVCKSIITLR